MIVGFRHYNSLDQVPAIYFEMLIQKNNDFPNYDILFMNVSLYNQSNTKKETKLEIKCDINEDAYHPNDANNKLYFSKNTIDSPISEYSLLPPEVQSDVTPTNDGTEIDVNNVSVDSNTVEDAMKETTDNNSKIEVTSDSGLTVEFAKKHGATHLIRGLRAVSDFEYEFQLASANEFIDSKIDTVFLMARGDKTFISSSSIITMAKQGVDVSKLVPDSVLKRLK